MELVSLKIMVLTISGVIRIFFGLIPLIIFRAFVRGSDKHQKIKPTMSYLMFFSGGVLLATCLVHMMPEVRESLNDEAKLDEKTILPVPELIFIGGFFLIYLLEDIIHGWIDRRRANKRNAKKAREFGVQNHGFTYNITPPSTVASPKQMFGHHLSGKRGEIAGLTPIPRIRAENNKLNGGITTIDPKFTYVDGDWWRDNVNGHSQLNLLNSNPNLSVRSASLYDIPLTPGGLKTNNNLASSTDSKNTWTDNHSHSHSHDDHSSPGHSHMHLPTSEEDESMAGTFRNLILIVAMSFHGVIEGMAIGLQSTEQNVWLFFLAVSLHECTILFCIGVELISSKTKVLRMITYILVVSLVCPIGIAIGIAVSETAFDKGSLERALVVGSLQGIAAGTLLYVTFFEIFAAEGRKLKGSKYLHILVALLGFAFMVFLQLIGGHVHGHGHSHGGGSDSGLKGSIVHDHDHDHDHDHHDHDHGHAPSGIHNNTLIYDHHHGHNHSHSHHDHDH